MLSTIVAIASNRAIGRDNQLLWHLPEDLRYFKSVTEGHPVIVGRNTFHSLGRPLPKRTNVVALGEFFEEDHKTLGGEIELLPSGGKCFRHNNVVYCQALNDAIDLGKEIDPVAAFIIGGASIYKATLGIVDKLYITEVDVVVEDADTFFPEIDLSIWKEDRRSETFRDDNSGLNFRFLTYIRK